MTLVSLLTLVGALITVAASTYNFCHYLYVWRANGGIASRVLLLLSLMTGIVGTYFVLVWFIQLDGGYVAWPVRHVWRSIALAATLAAALLQTWLLLNAREKA